jgi:hypothetical protein
MVALISFGVIEDEVGTGRLIASLDLLVRHWKLL